MLMNVQTKLVAKDRTGDFQAIVERLKSQGATSSSLDVSRPGTTTASQHAQFSAKAQAMSMRISQLATRIQNLTRLARQSTMYNDNSQQVQEMTAQVKTGLTGLNEELQELQAMSRQGGASGQGGSHSSRVVDNLRVQLNGTTSKFKSVLEVRREALKASEDRRSLFTSSAPAPDTYQASFFEDAPSNDAASGSETQALIQATAPQADSYLQSRDEALTQINATIQDLGGIFNQMAEMVQQQGEMAVRIDENVDNVVENVDAAQVQLLKYLQTISSNRWLALKVFSILVVFVLLFIFMS